MSHKTPDDIPGHKMFTASDPLPRHPPSPPAKKKNDWKDELAKLLRLLRKLEQKGE